MNGIFDVFGSLCMEEDVVGIMHLETYWDPLDWDRMDSFRQRFGQSEDGTLIPGFYFEVELKSLLFE